MIFLITIGTNMLLDLLMIVFFIAVMFVPTFIAYKRNLKRRFACFWINLLVGWTIIGWIPLIAWAALTSAIETGGTV
jgi:hypothetical protein